MATSNLDYAKLFAANLPQSAPRWGGFPTYNFIGGHNNPDEIPIEGLIEASARILRREGRHLATYNMESGPLGYIGLREFLVEKLAHYRSVRAPIEEILITSGSNQGIDLINDVLLQPGDTVIAEQFTYQGTLSRLRKRRVNIVGVPLDDEGMRMDALATTLEELRRRGVTPKYIYTIPTLQNPTGTILSLERRHELLRLSQLAVNRAKSARVQDFARTVAEERAEANDQLRELALTKGVPLAAEPTAEQQHVIDAMDELAGSEFDTEYMAHQVRSYEDAIVLHRTQLDQTEDPDLRGYAESSLALLEQHLETAQALAEQVQDTAN